ncbi:MBL fold metallo-hydrolase [Desulfosporosinus sp.]|uniref:MBL fold metallo-hydrolase n=1 Tax=Desulfosporosinus sp. TaxID=157907 RepID=UPI00231C2FBD|nr:MBL fold metallo-hydrolase [Desulfosporosinus sp.]MDA8223556.1 MBL fold metallo-hydrolase [Desulfitobacterium hafniense]
MAVHILTRHKGQDKQEVRIFNSIVRMLGTTLNVYAYIVDGMLIDSGPHKLRSGILDFCLQNQPDKIVHTHFHEDHTGNTAYLVKKLQVPAYIHPDSLGICRMKGDIPFYRLAFWGHRMGFQAEPLPDFIENEHSRFEVIQTPGHTTDHVAFLDREEGRLFSGDLFLHQKTRVVRRKENIPLIMESLRTLLKESFETVYCAHGGEIKQGYRLVEQKLAYLEELQEEILNLSQQGMDIKAIVKRIFPQTPVIAYFSLGEFSSYNLVRSLIEDKVTGSKRPTL